MAANRYNLLWQLDSGAAGRPSFLFGTMHTRLDAAFTHVDRLQACIDACAVFAAEYHLDEGAATAGMQPEMLLPEGQSLEQLLQPKHYAKLRRIMHKAYGVDIHPLRFFRPMVIQSLLDERLLSGSMPLTLDHYLWQYASGAGKQMEGLESFASQMAILRKLPLDDELRSMRKLGRNIAGHRRHLGEMSRHYAQGDAHHLLQVTRRSIGAQRRILLFDRNRIMADRILELMQQGPVFAAVGAAHLAGGKGVLRLLKQQGVRPKKVRMNPD